MRTVDLGMLLVFQSGIYAVMEFSAGGDIRNFAVGNGKVFVVTDSQLFQLQHDLVEEKRKDISNHTHQNHINILLPFDANQTLITCGTSGCGYCEVLNISDITRSIYREGVRVGPPGNESSVSLLVDFDEDKAKTQSYMLVARERKVSIKECGSDVGVRLRSTLDTQPGGIFSKSNSVSTEAYISPESDVEWVDGFQTSSPSHSYLLVNVKSDPAVVVLRMKNNKMKSDMIKSVQGAVLQCCEDKDRKKLLSSSVVLSSGSPLLWAGIFTAQEDHDPQNTALAIYDLSQLRNQVPSHFTYSPPGTAQKGNQVLSPRAVVYKHSSMSSVAAEKEGSWIVVYIGTESGQLMKIVLDKAFNSGCATVLYRSDDDRKVFPRMLFDPVDHKYIYIALRNQIRQVAVTQCGIYSTLRDCRSSKDPSCGWCVTTETCSTTDECPKSSWISIPEDSFQKELISFQVMDFSPDLTLNLHLSLEATGNPNLSCTFMNENKNLCNSSSAVFPNCSCKFSSQRLPVNVTANVTIGDQHITEKLKLRSCPDITETSTYHGCVACVSAGCHWSDSKKCSWADGSASQNACEGTTSGRNAVTDAPEIFSLEPSEVSFHGKTTAVLKGKNLELVKKIRFQGFMECILKETPVLDRSSHTLKFSIPSGNKGTTKVCVVTEDGRCHSNATITYGSQPTCTRLKPTNTWTSGGRKIKVLGNYLGFVDAVMVYPSQADLTLTLNSTNKTFWFHTANQRETRDFKTFNVSLKVGHSRVDCVDTLSYLPDPEFNSFSTSKVDNDIQVTIQKRADSLNLSDEDMIVWCLQEDKLKRKCVIADVKSTAVTCKVLGEKEHDFRVDSLEIICGNFSKKILLPPSSAKYGYTVVTLIILIVLGALVGVFIHRKSKQQMSARMNERLELLESEIRNEIRQGFVDLQTEKSDLIENVGAIPFLDYKHFALKIFFPEGGPLASLMVKDIGQDAIKTEADAKSQALSALIRDQTFLTCFVHALEEQKNFSIKDKCVVASLLTVALHSDLPYLTQLMEDLLQSLMDLPSNAQPKLLLRRTESIVEKLLTNWMSICLYGFLRESVGQPLFLLVSALTQQISKGPVDAVTEKALYTLNEDWLLWQAQGFNFSPLKLKVLFAVGTDGEVSEPLEVNALSCDTIEQVKEKILLTFQRKFGFSYTQQLREIDIEFEKEGNYVPLEEVDGSSEVQGEVTMLNTLKHYQIPDGASIKVMTKKVHAPLSPQTSLKDDQNFSTKYFHLIDPDIDRDESNHPERKKLKLKEIYLTKLLSTKVAVHSFVESLFRSIWGMPNNKAPSAVKYFFDFLDVQAEKKKITDPDVLHIWKTNSLPLRFWVNILKNPNFVFSDLEKTPHLDGCLSVIAQAFMDSFSLTDQQLGKHAPTNKLLYAKDIPQYKQDVKAYYKLVRDQPSVSSQEFKTFLQDESKKHENEFNESAALRELYKYMNRYFPEIIQKLEEKEASSKLTEELYRVKDLFEDMKRSAWT